MSVSLCNGSGKRAWDEFVRLSPLASCYHLSGWRDVVEKSFGNSTYYLKSESEGRIRGVLPLVHLKSAVFGNFMVSMPYFNYGGICAEGEEAAHELLEEASRIAKDLGATHIELRHARRLDCGLPCKTTKVAMELTLPETPDELFASFPSKLRSQVKRPQKDGLTAVIEKKEGLDAFYHAFSINMRDLGTPAYSKGFFRNILDTFPDSTWICTVRMGGEPVAAGFLAGFRDRLEIPWASSVKRYNRLSPNMLLYWTVLKFACESGFKVFDFGRSTYGEGTFRFKEQWGAKPVQLYWHYWLRGGGKLPEINPDNPKYRMAIRVWQNLPVSLTRLLGPMVVKNIP